MKEKISAVILNYRHPEDTIKCLKSLIDSNGGREVEYYLVDNSPVLSIEKKFKKLFPQVLYLASPKNLGFAGGNNLAIRNILETEAKYILIINPDVTVGESFFVPLLKNFKDPEVGLVAPVISHVQKNKRVYGLEGVVDWHYAKPTHRNLPTLKETKPIDSQFVTFACVLISRNTIEKAGLLDEGYFMYFEDVDYCLTTLKAGKKIILDPRVMVDHQTSSSFKRPTQKLVISFRSHLRFIKKWLPFSKRLVPFLYALILYPYLYVLWTYHGLKYKHV